MTDGIRLLHAEDDAGFARLTADLLEDDGFEVASERTVADAMDRFAETAVDCIVSDHELPDGTGIEFLRSVRETDLDVPFVLFTGRGSEAVASDAFAAGATDYLQKEAGTEQFTLLAKRIENAVESARAKRQRERRLAAIETADEGIAILTEETGRYRYVNEAYADIYGHDPEAMVGEHWSLVYPNDRVDRVTEEILPAVTEEGVWHGTTTGLRADGTTIVEDHTFSLSDGGDLICSVRDVTDEAEREADLERFRTVVQAIGDPVYAIDADGHFTFVNEAYAALTGYDRAELLGAHATFVVDQASMERSRDVVRTLLSGDADIEQETFEVTVETADRTELRCEDSLSLLPLDDGEFQGVAGVIRDITEREQRAYELRRYKQMANAAADMVYVLDADGRIEFVNDAATELTGYDRETLIGSHVDLFMPEPDIGRGRDLVTRLMAPDAPDSASYEWTLHRADGETVPCESHIAVVADEDGLCETTGVVREIADRRARERKLQRKNDQLADFASIVSHDLRNPIEVAQIRLGLTDADDEHLTHVESALSRMERIIDDTLALARQGQRVEEPAPVAVGNLARNCWSMVATDGATLSVTPFTVDGDPDRLKQVFENLFRNSVEHGPLDETREPARSTDGGDPTVTVTVAPLPAGDGFYVADDGRGIPPDERERVFEGGYSTDDDGTGFGLPIVERIVEAHGWTVTATESERGGARFEVTGVDSLSVSVS